MTDHLVVRQLRAIRDLAETALELLGDEVDPRDPGPCPHPKEKRRPAGVMGDPDRFFCMECRTLVSIVTVDAASAPAVEA